MELRPLLAVSMGDPVGIGPEVVVKALSVPAVRDVADLVVFGDLAALIRAAAAAHLEIDFRRVGQPAEARAFTGQRQVAVIDHGRIDPERFAFAKPTPETDAAQLEYIENALAALEHGEAEGLVTAPINKASINRAGAPWPGHTEMLAQLCGRWPEQRGEVLKPVMMLAGDHLKVVPLTTHVPLAAVPQLITPELVLHGIRVIHQSFYRYFGHHRPRIAVAGLNPHAGEHGLFGTEEHGQIVPALKMATAEGITVFGPLPPDSVFRRALEGEFDVVLGMYHDQALIPLKLLDFDRAVNVTLGLPIIRTSVDHGTAYDLAGQGVASAGSMIAALKLAASMVRERRRTE